MFTARAECTISAPIERVFDIVSDHENYARFPGIQSSELMRAGDPERNGVGAIRRVRSWPMRMEEEIIRFERPTGFDYLIRRINFPTEHLEGVMRLEEAGSGTRVVWTSTFRYTLPLISRPLEMIIGPMVSRGFRRVLDEVSRLATAPSAVGAPA